jgi:hypothetical protein
MLHNQAPRPRETPAIPTLLHPATTGEPDWRYFDNQRQNTHRGMKLGTHQTRRGCEGAPTNITLTTAWQRFKITGTLAGVQTGL